MKVKRYKRAKRIISIYRHNFNLEPPYQVLLDGTFAMAALQSKINLREQMPKYLNAVSFFFSFSRIIRLVSVCCSCSVIVSALYYFNLILLLYFYANKLSIYFVFLITFLISKIFSIIL